MLMYCDCIIQCSLDHYELKISRRLLLTKNSIKKFVTIILTSANLVLIIVKINPVKLKSRRLKDGNQQTSLTKTRKIFKKTPLISHSTI